MKNKKIDSIVESRFEMSYKKKEKKLANDCGKERRGNFLDGGPGEKCRAFLDTYA